MNSNISLNERAPDAPATASKWRNAAPALTLLLLSPVIAEVLFGATRISFIFVLIPEIGAWGCSALIIRHVVNSRHRGWVSILLLAAALAIAEECVIQQTSLAPLLADPSRVYGRAVGVNWVYLLWAVGYESVWAILIPIRLTELIFPDRRDDAWMGRRGLIAALAVFTLSALVAWYSWTQVGRPAMLHVPVYRPPILTVAIAVALIALLIFAALSLKPRSKIREQARRSAPGAGLAGIATFVLAAPWTGLVLLAYGAAPSLPVAVPLAVGIGLIVVTFSLINYWFSSAAWSDTHRLAVIIGAIAASMLGGFTVFKLGGALEIDLIGKIILNTVAMALMALLFRKVRSRPSA